MKRSLIEKIPYVLPDSLTRLIAGSRIYDSSCSPEARVYYVEKDGGFYLKRAERGTLLRECEMYSYFHGMGLAPEVLDYHTGECDWLLTRRAVGEDMLDARYLSEPKRLARLLGEELRRLHEISPVGCPACARLTEYCDTVEKNYLSGEYDKSHFPDSFGYSSAEEAISVFRDGRHLLRQDTLIHGDYCLPNIMLDDWRLSAFIDLGNAGVADRHIDLFWGEWTLEFNLGTDEYVDEFFDAYGRDKIDPDILRVVAAAEVFG